MATIVEVVQSNPVQIIEVAVPGIQGPAVDTSNFATNASVDTKTAGFVASFSAAWSPGTPWQAATTTFVTVPLNTVVLNGTGFDTTTGIYTVQRTGYYDITAKLRPVDSYGAGSNIGVGVDVSNSDNPDFVWFPVTAAVRHTFSFTRHMYLTSGQQVRLYTYVEGIGRFLAASLSLAQIGR